MKQQNTEAVKVSSIVGTNFIKLAKMNMLIPMAFAGSDATQISIYIDTYSIIERIYGTNVYFEHELELAELILDMCAYYRRYFKSFGVDTVFYIVSSYNVPVISKQLIPEYNSGFAMKLTSGIHMTIENNMNALNVLCPYLHGVHFIRSSYESAVCMASVMQYDSNPKIILSRDIYNLQLVSVDNSCVYLRPSKHRGTDNSRIIFDPFTFWQEFSISMKVNVEKIMFNPRSLPSLLALTKLPQRSLKSILNTAGLINKINSCIDKGILNPDNVDINTILSAMKSEKLINSNLSAAIENGIIDSRFKCIDIMYQLEIYNHSTEFATTVKESLKDLYDPKGVEHINNKYFKGVLQLQDLL